MNEWVCERKQLACGRRYVFRTLWQMKEFKRKFTHSTINNTPPRRQQKYCSSHKSEPKSTSTVCMCACASETAALSCFANAFQSLCGCACEWEIAFDIPHMHSISNTTQSDDNSHVRNAMNMLVYTMYTAMCFCVRVYVLGRELSIPIRESTGTQRQDVDDSNAMQCNVVTILLVLVYLITPMFTSSTFKWLPRQSIKFSININAVAIETEIEMWIYDSLLRAVGNIFLNLVQK